jgi:serine/threonine protein kinase
MDRSSECFGRYEILSELGRGAMGVVYKARDPKINRIVAVKTISLAGQAPEEEREYRERFFREAEAAGRVSHPGIVTIFDVGEELETRFPYLVMEFVGGQSLDKVLSQDDHKLPAETALQLALELADALDCAHSQGVVHRDLKPSNILLTEDGRAKIADFGVAKLNLTNHTLAGCALATSAYMSPEQLNGETVDGRSDLFSLGVILYTALIGYSPFQGNSAITISFKVVNRDPIPATVRNTDLPDGLDSIIARAMAKDPAERYQRGQEMVLDIQHLRQGREPQSKINLPDWLTRRGVGRTAQTEGRSPALGQPGVAAKPRSGARAFMPPNLATYTREHLLLATPVSESSGSSALFSGEGVTKNLPEKRQKKSLARVLVLGGLFIFGLWIISFGSHGVRPRAAEPLAQAAEALKTAATSTTPAASAVASDGTAPTPGVEKRSTQVSAGRVRPIPKQLARANSPVVPPATSPGPSADASPATLGIEVNHRFAEANLSIWVDDRLAYTRRLEGTDKKRLVVFHHVQGHELHAMQVPPGKHNLRVQVTSEGATFDQSATVAGEFASGLDNVLRININKHGEMNVSLQ